MPQHLSIAIRFLDGLFHGRRDGGEPEWPPSPLRVFQALVAASAAQTNERTQLAQAAPMLRWLESLPAPLIAAPLAERGGKYRLYVPDNVADLVARSWRRGNEASIADYRSEKDVQPVRLMGGDAVHYLWSLAEGDADFAQHRTLLEPCVRAITHLGWGVDMVVAIASLISDAEAEQLPGRRWHPAEGDSRNVLRVPTTGTLDGLTRRYAAFLRRARPESFAPVPPLAKFHLVSYLTGTEPPALPFAAFSFLTPDAERMRPFDPVRNGMRVAGMLRHAAGADNIVAALGWPDEKVKHMVYGHAEKIGEAHQPVAGPRFAFIPLPTVEFRGKGHAEVVGSARRALVLGMRGTSPDDVQQLARLLAGQPLTDEQTAQSVALLARLPHSDTNILRYTKLAVTWATVTPLVLPGYDDPRKYRRELFRHDASEAGTLDTTRQERLLSKLEQRIDHLIRKAIRQAGFPDELARHAEIDWSATGYWPGTDLATRYAVPAMLRRFRRIHVRITWKDDSGIAIPIRGPICLGSGRFVGLGLFAPQ